MSTNDIGLAAALEPSAIDGQSHRGQQRWWGVVATGLVAATFAEAVLAGAMLSGAGWARPLHGLVAGILLISSVGAGAVALMALRRSSQGRRLALILLALGGGVLAQAVLGILAAKGANLLWLHVPLGVGLVGVATQTVAAARRL